jgi:hypothetical protein
LLRLALWKNASPRYQSGFFNRLLALLCSAGVEDGGEEMPDCEAVVGAGWDASAVYLPPLVEKCGAQAFVSQCIPTDPALLSREQYKAFLVRRRELIAAALNRFLGTAPSDGG